MSVDLEGMTTETRNARTMRLDRMTPLEIVTVMNDEDKKVPEAITPHLAQIAQIIEWTTNSVRNGGRVYTMGAGTSGRLCVLDAAECPPTFGVSSDLMVGLIAGGERAFLKAVEGAEDSKDLGREDLRANGLTKMDTVIGLAASGRTPYVIGGLLYAKELGCHTVAIACNQGSEIGRIAELKIEIIVGPEVLTGSTRLKAGTAEKLVLNMISTATMVGIGKCYQNLMVDVMQTNEKLHARAQNIVMEITGVSREEAMRFLDVAGGSVKTALVMILSHTDRKGAEERLEASGGHVWQCIGA